MPSKTEVPNDQLERLQHGAEGAWFLLIWLAKGMYWQGSASGKRGRRPQYSGAAIQFCLTIKGLFNLALRQAMGMA